VDTGTGDTEIKDLAKVQIKNENDIVNLIQNNVLSIMNVVRYTKTKGEDKAFIELPCTYNNSCTH
jgi:hypothetical protein